MSSIECRNWAWYLKIFGDILGIALLSIPAESYFTPWPIPPHLFQLHVLHGRRRREFAATLQDHLHAAKDDKTDDNRCRIRTRSKHLISGCQVQTYPHTHTYLYYIYTYYINTYIYVYIYISTSHDCPWLVRPGAGGRSSLPKGILAVPVSANAAALISSSCRVSRSTALPS